MDRLSAFLYEATARRFAFGTWDCGHYCGAWVARCCGIDPAAPWRGAYDDEAGLALLLESRGGIVAHFDDAMRQAGATRTDDPGRGAVAIVGTEQGLTGGIVTGTCVALLAGRGLLIRHRALAPISAAWSV